jgi:hypothetical protein
MTTHSNGAWVEVRDHSGAQHSDDELTTHTPSPRQFLSHNQLTPQPLLLTSLADVGLDLHSPLVLRLAAIIRSCVSCLPCLRQRVIHLLPLRSPVLVAESKDPHYVKIPSPMSVAMVMKTLYPWAHRHFSISA